MCVSRKDMRSLQKVHDTLDRCYQLKILVLCAHASHHINLFQSQLHSILLLGSTHHIDWKHLTVEQDGAQENREDILVLKGAVILRLAVSKHRLLRYRVYVFDRISVLFSPLWSNKHFREWEEREKPMTIIPVPVCGPLGDGRYQWRIW